MSLSPSLLNCLAAWRDLSEISLKFQYLHVQIELINFRRIILKTLFFLFVLSNVDIGINSNWLWSLPELHLKILTPLMHLTQALKEHVKDKGSQVLLREIRNRKNPSVMSFYASVNMKLTGSRSTSMDVKILWKEESKVRSSCLTSGIHQWSRTPFWSKHLTFLMVSKNWGDLLFFPVVLTRGSTPGKWNIWPGLNLDSAHFHIQQRIEGKKKDAKFPSLSNSGKLYYCFSFLLYFLVLAK